MSFEQNSIFGAWFNDEANEAPVAVAEREPGQPPAQKNDMTEYRSALQSFGGAARVPSFPAVEDFGLVVEEPAPATAESISVAQAVTTTATATTERTENTQSTESIQELVTPQEFSLEVSSPDPEETQPIPAQVAENINIRRQGENPYDFMKRLLDDVNSTPVQWMSKYAPWMRDMFQGPDIVEQTEWGDNAAVYEMKGGRGYGWRYVIPSNGDEPYQQLTSPDGNALASFSASGKIMSSRNTTRSTRMS